MYNKQRQTSGIIGEEIIKVMCTVKSISLYKSRFSSMHAKMQPELLRSIVWHHTASRTGGVKAHATQENPTAGKSRDTPDTQHCYPLPTEAGCRGLKDEPCLGFFPKSS